MKYFPRVRCSNCELGSLDSQMAVGIGANVWRKVRANGGARTHTDDVQRVVGSTVRGWQMHLAVTGEVLDVFSPSRAPREDTSDGGVVLKTQDKQRNLYPPAVF